MKAEFDNLRMLGMPAQFSGPGKNPGDGAPAWKANAHVHLPPNFTAFESVAQAVLLAAQQGVRVLGASNYYDFEVYAGFAAEGRRRGVFPLFGVEVIALIEDLQRAGVLINDPGNPGRMYLCGKGIAGFSPMSDAAAALMREIRQNDTVRMRLMIERLGRIFAARGLDTGLSEEKIVLSLVRRYGVQAGQVCLQERHVARAFQEAVFDRVPPGKRIQKLSEVLGILPKHGPEDAVGVQNGIRTHLMKVGKPAFVPERFVNFQQAFRLVLELGGIPCYPTLADGAAPICPYENPPERLVEVLKQHRVHCAEFIPIRNQPEILGRYVQTARGAGMVVTAGTEHNTSDLIPLEPFCTGGRPVPECIQEIFREGACVVAAHQHLVSNGECGYVNRDGELNPDFESVERRIDHFRRLGAAVIAGYHEQTSHEGAIVVDGS